MTLFNRYKNMINRLWSQGERQYTATTLNNLVGVYEKETHWKKWNKCPYYTTRTYQTQLRDLGCITMVKRGVWQINGPIPEWFGSFHLRGLTSSDALKNLEKSSFYWQSLSEEHKINPWRIQQINTNNMTNHTQKPQGIDKMTIGQDTSHASCVFLDNSCEITIGNKTFKIEVQWSLYEKSDKTLGADLLDSLYSNGDGTNIVGEQWDKFKAYLQVATNNDNIVDDLRKYVEESLYDDIIQKGKVYFELNQQKQPVETAGKFTPHNLEELISRIGEVINNWENDTLPDVKDNIELSISYNNCIDVELGNLYGFCDSLKSDIDDVVGDYFDELND